VVRIDGEAVLEQLRLAVVDGKRVPKPVQSWEFNFLLDRLFVHIIREFLHRNRGSSQRGGGKQAFDDVMSGLKRDTH
jgi:hypothetical protein